MDAQVLTIVALPGKYGVKRPTAHQKRPITYQKIPANK